MLNSRLDSGSPCFGSFSDLENVALFVCLYRCLLVSVYLLQEADVIVIDVERFEGVPN